MRKSARAVASTLLVSGLVFAAMTSPAEAYVDPNSVGPIYQFLFPLLVAIASVFAMFKRAVRRLWDRLFGIRDPVAATTREADSTDAE